MPALLPTLKLDHNPTLAKHFLPYQFHWIEAEDPTHHTKAARAKVTEHGTRNTLQPPAPQLSTINHQLPNPQLSLEFILPRHHARRPRPRPPRRHQPPAPRH